MNGLPFGRGSVGGLSENSGKVLRDSIHNLVAVRVLKPTQIHPADFLSVPIS